MSGWTVSGIGSTVVNRRRPSFVGVWLSESGAAQIAERAELEKVDKSEMLRRMLAYAIWKMPKGWKP